MLMRPPNGDHAASPVSSYRTIKTFGAPFGAVGSAYGMLALSRIDPGGDWLLRAHELAMAVMVSEIQPEWAHGLFKGEAGTFCLAMDLLSGDTRFPCLEA